MKSDQLILTVVWVLGGAFVLFAYYLRVKHGKEIQKRIIGIAQQLGLSEIRPRWWFGNGMRARWQGFAVDSFFRARYKSTPARVVTKVAVDGAPRIVITRKFGESWLQKPKALVGPPVVEFDAAQLWVRADASRARRALPARSESGGDDRAESRRPLRRNRDRREMDRDSPLDR